MNALIPSASDGLTMNSLEISALVEKRHDNVKRTIETLAEQCVIALPQIEDVQEIGGNNRAYTTQVYCFTGERGKRDSIIVVAQLCPEFTARLVDRWQALEQQVAFAALPDFTNPAAAARAWAEQIEQKQIAEAHVALLELQIEDDAPKVAFAQQVEAAPDAITVSKAAKLLDTGRTRLFAFMREIGWVTRYNEPYQEKIEAGLLGVKLGNWDHPDHGLQQSVTTLITGKGLSKLQQLWGQRQQAINGAAIHQRSRPGPRPHA